ncbi:hypothetical protein [Actinoplanes sp. NBRC 103695]|uniref:hypothetical protein n=1 Tax=Actinoplanes sp. NBRC 103695 TaxID=3032202 RepID=UPI0024A24BB2|nr:hypothetical protein [Actinoplanes sp. NBRC 103695]GLZ02184.1 hypothetical protein Acsp02_94350 [Actinoplanes sp. NBRC 103695]
MTCARRSRRTSRARRSSSWAGTPPWPATRSCSRPNASLQPTGSFKVRSATYKISSEESVVAYSTGNHAQSVARADVVAVSESDIATARRLCATEAHLVVEPPGAVGVAAALAHAGSRDTGRPVVAIASGGNG